MEVEEDRLSSLPDEILTNILSFLPIHLAATTSVLSHRWRHLWTGVTHVQIDVCEDDVLRTTDLINPILRKLTSPKLHSFYLDVSYMSDDPEPSASVSWFRKVCNRNVEKIVFDAEFPNFQFSFWIPSFVFNSQYLVTLKLYGVFEWPNIEDLHFNLPNLKRLTLDCLDDIPLWLETLIKSSPLLEFFNLVFNLTSYSELSSYAVNVIAPHLKFLFIRLEIRYGSKTLCTRVSIDAPKLENLEIQDSNSIYYFLRRPTTLVKACFDLKKTGWEGYWEGEEEGNGSLHHLHVPPEEFLRQMTKFVGGLSSVSNLELRLENHTNIFRYHSSVNLPMFYNLTWLKTTCSIDLFTLHRFPNLKHLEMCWSQLLPTLDTMEQSCWLPPDSIPECLLSMINTIEIREVQGTDDTLRVLEYILCNANVLKKLCIRFRMADRPYLQNERDKAYAMWKECQFCRSLFKFPKSSSTCEVVVSGNYVKASSNTLQDRYLTCQMSLG